MRSEPGQPVLLALVPSALSRQQDQRTGWEISPHMQSHSNSRIRTESAKVAHFSTGALGKEGPGLRSLFFFSVLLPHPKTLCPTRVTAAVPLMMDPDFQKRKVFNRLSLDQRRSKSP